MPPRIMFRDKLRPSGMEFAVCRACNSGTSAADLVASFLAKMERFGKEGSWMLDEAIASKAKLEQLAPGFLHELFSRRPAEQRYSPMASGILAKQAVITADGPLTKAYLNVFSTKLTMALYREYCGHALPEEGVLQTSWYLNAGLSQTTAEAFLSIMPSRDRLTQGSVTSQGQFDYRYNTDRKSIVAFLAGFHNGLHIWGIATATPVEHGLPRELPYGLIARSGDVLGMMPKLDKSQLLLRPAKSSPGPRRP